MAAASDTAEPTVVGKPRARVDGPVKTTGRAQYTSDFHFPGMLYGVPVPATIAAGEIKQLDVATAEKMPGVVAVLHRKNIGKLFRIVEEKAFDETMVFVDEARPPFDDDTIRYYGQYVALVVATTWEQAKAAARKVRVDYNRGKHDVDPVLKQSKESKIQSERGDVAAAWAKAEHRIDAQYEIPPEFHTPIELHATVALFDGLDFTLYESTQAIVNHRNALAQILGVPQENVRVISKFLGSGFGGKLWPWTHAALAAAAARQLKAPVQIVLDRKLTFYAAGHRPRISQRIRLSATKDGKLTSLQQDYVNDTSILDDYEEDCGEATSFFYSVPNLRVTKDLARRNIGTPTSMRGPGAVPGLFALESALDELALTLKIDPVELRLKNEPKLDEGLGIPFSSRHFMECLQVGRERFGWEKRNPQIGSMKQNGSIVGWGVAGCTWIASRIDVHSSVELRANGSARVSCAVQDIGTGTYTILAILAAEKLGLPVEKIEVVLGDSSLPAGPLSGGSLVTGSLVPAIGKAADAAIESLLKLIGKLPDSPFKDAKSSDLRYTAGRVHLKDQAPAKGHTYFDLLRRANVNGVTGRGSAKGMFGKEKPKFSTHSFGAQFVEVLWQPEIARLRVNRVVSVIDAGRILNPLAGRNQIEGAVVMGVGMALFEAGHYDQKSGALLNSNMADYIVSVHADVPELDVHFLNYPDTHLNEFGARGIGEIGLAGVAPAIANAVHHATGLRIRELPITIEKLLAAPVAGKASR
jgi:xanthine dehydrogenase YagR molybdenum-binding subunit